MEYVTAAQKAQRWGVSAATVCRYCTQGRIPGAYQEGKLWYVPANAEKPDRLRPPADAPATLLDVLKRERSSKKRGGVYQQLQIDFAYDSNHIEGSCLTYEQARALYEGDPIDAGDGTVDADDVAEMSNHFRCVDLVIRTANYSLSETFIKQLHLMLRGGTSDRHRDWVAAGDYKHAPNLAGSLETTPPAEVNNAMRSLLEDYTRSRRKTLDDALDFHYRFERIHPFQDGNGRVGRLVLLKECLRNDLVPFSIGEDLQSSYYRGLEQWEQDRTCLRGTCRTAQDRFKAVLDHFKIAYKQEI